MNLKIIFNSLNCYNKNSIWYKPTCKVLFDVTCIPIFGFFGAMALCAIIFIVIAAIAGIIITIVQIGALITVVTGLDFDGKIYYFLYHDKENAFLGCFNKLLNYDTSSYVDLFFVFFIAIGACWTFIVLICLITYIIGIFIRDIFLHGRNVYKQPSFLYACIMIITYFTLAILPLLFTFIYGIGKGIIVLFDWSRIGNIDNHTLYNDAMNNITWDKINNYYDYTIIFGMIIGVISIIIIPLLITCLLLRCCIRGLSKDVTETYQDLEAGERHKEF